MGFYDGENTAGNTRRCHPDRQNSSFFHPSNRAKVFIWQNLQPAYRDPGWKNRDLGNRASRVSRIHVKRPSATSVKENLRSLFTFLCRARTWSVTCTHMTLRLPVLTNSLPAGEYFSFWPFSRATHYKQTNPVKVTRISKASIGFNKQNNNSARASRTFLSVSFYTTTTWNDQIYWSSPENAKGKAINFTVSFLLSSDAGFILSSTPASYFPTQRTEWVGIIEKNFT